MSSTLVLYHPQLPPSTAWHVGGKCSNPNISFWLSPSGHVSFVAEKYNKQRRRETIQCGGNIMIFSKSSCSEQQYNI